MKPTTSPLGRVRPEGPPGHGGRLASSPASVSASDADQRPRCGTPGGFQPDWSASSPRITPLALRVVNHPILLCWSCSQWHSTGMPRNTLFRVGRFG
jgi:hypothetical protein